MGFLILLVFLIALGSLLGWLAFFKISALTKSTDSLRRQQHLLLDRVENLSQQLGSGQVSTGQQEHGLAIEKQNNPGEGFEEPQSSTAAPPEEVANNVWHGPEESPSRFSQAASEKVPAGPSSLDKFIDSFKTQWMTWLGGLSVSLAGIFLVRYSIEQGLLGPAARVSLGIIAGLSLHGAAEWMRRNNRGQFQAFAALAGAASITLYAALLAALHLYSLLPAWTVFVGLILVSFLTMYLALLHGPVLAILGILGAYLVPLLVDTGSDSILGLYLYSLIITAASLVLMRHVYRYWLWLGVLAGSLGWWAMSLFTNVADGFRGYYLAVLAYFFLAIPAWDWALQKADLLQQKTDKTQSDASSSAIFLAPVFLSTALIVLAMGVTLLTQAPSQSAILYWTPLLVVLFTGARNKNSQTWMPLASLIVQSVVLLTRGLSFNDGIQLVGYIGPEQQSFMVYAGWMAFLYSALSLHNFKSQQSSSMWMAIALMSPLVWLALCHLLVTDLSGSYYWGGAAVALGVLYLSLATWRIRVSSNWKVVDDSVVAVPDTSIIWLILAGHFAYSLAVTIMVTEARLTLALAAQLVSLAWIIQRFNFPQIGLLLKLVLAVIVVRLTLNPWLLTYPNELHWSLWSYGGSTLCAAFGCWWLKNNLKLRQWLEVATLHLLVLTLWAETRYWLYDGMVFQPRFEFLEMAINAALWSSLGLVYYRRHLVSENLKGLYLLASKIMLCLAIIAYGMVLLPLNPALNPASEALSSTPIFNQLLLAFGFPVIISICLYRYYDSRFKKFSGMAAGITGFIFISLEIRHLWKGAIGLDLPTGNGELYTYTIVWMLLALTGLLAGSIRYGKSVYRAGLGLLILVIGKIFIIDMDDLEGLLRVASFMGLGLSLLGLAYLYQRFNLVPKEPVKSE